MRRRVATSVFAVFTVSFLSSALAGDWAQWRGPNHDGLSAEKGFRSDWGETTPPQLWKRELGSAFSGMSLVGDRLYTCGTAGGQQVTYCLNAATGDVVWQTPFEEEYPEKQGGDGTRATPAIDGGKVYVQGARGRVVCFNAADGKPLWNATFTTLPKWGYSASVLIEGDLAIVTGDNALAALDKQTGETRWTAAGSGGVGYATPYPFTFGGQRYVVGFMAKEALVVDAKTGREVLRLPWETAWDVNAATPIFSDGYLFISSGYKHGSLLVKLRAEGDKLAFEQVWPNDGVKPGDTIQAKFQTPVLYDGYLYTSDDVGLRCAEFLTGKEQWKQRGMNHGTCIIADGKLLVLTEDGELQIGPASPKGFTPTTKARVQTGRCWTIPTLVDGRLYVRNLETLACYNLKGS